MVLLSPNTTRFISRFAVLTPTMHRLSIGVTGLGMQTSIDYTNPNVDKDTQKYSAIRTAVKMVVTTAGGVLFRILGQGTGERLVEKGIMGYKIDVPATVIKEYVGKSQVALKREYADLIGKSVEKISTKITPEMIARKDFGHRIGVVCAIMFALISIFAWDMPFTNKIMNFVIDKVYKGGPPKSENSH